MDPPSVYIEREPLLVMVMAAIDPFKRECLGWLFGKKPSRNRNYFSVEMAVPVQSATMRKNSEIQQSKKSQKRMEQIWKEYPNLYSLIGDFHSHPERGNHDGSPELSEKDVADMKNWPELLGIVIGISSRKKRPSIPWQNNNGVVRGTFNRYIFEVQAYRLRKEKEVFVPERINIVLASSVLKSLNRANSRA